MVLVPPPAKALSRVLWSASGQDPWSAVHRGDITTPSPLQGWPGTGYSSPGYASASQDAGDQPTLLTPAEGAMLSAGAVVLSGHATAPEGTLLWHVRRRTDGAVVASGHATAGANGDVGPWSTSVDLEPGDYEILLSVPDEEDGVGTASGASVRSFSVH